MEHTPKKSYLEYHPSISKSITDKWADESLRLKYCEKFREFISLMIDRIQQHNTGKLDDLIGELVFLRNILKTQCEMGSAPQMEIRAEIEQYKHILKKINVFWGSAFILEYVDSLLYVSRGGREGFSPETLDELKFLQLFLENHFDETLTTKPSRDEQKIIDNWKADKGDKWRFRGGKPITLDMIEFTPKSSK